MFSLLQALRSLLMLLDLHSTFGTRDHFVLREAQSGGVLLNVYIKTF